MKKIAFLALILLTQLTFSQDKQRDSKLFGSWYGTEKDKQVKGMTKNWIMHRFEDGNFILLFTTVQNGEVSNFKESGKWWTENDTFYEYHNNSQMTDVYTYQILDENRVKFKMKSTEVEFNDGDYEFIDTKLEENL